MWCSYVGETSTFIRFALQQNKATLQFGIYLRFIRNLTAFEKTLAHFLVWVGNVHWRDTANDPRLLYFFFLGRLIQRTSAFFGPCSKHQRLLWSVFSCWSEGSNLIRQELIIRFRVQNEWMDRKVLTRDWAANQLERFEVVKRNWYFPIPDVIAINQFWLKSRIVINYEKQQEATTTKTTKSEGNNYLYS